MSYANCGRHYRLEYPCRAGSSWRLFIKTGATYLLLIYVLSQILQMFYSSPMLLLKTSNRHYSVMRSQNINGIRRYLQGFSSALPRPSYNEIDPNTDYSNDYSTTSQSIQDACFASTTSTYKNMTKTIQLSFDNTSKYYNEVSPQIFCYIEGTDLIKSKNSSPIKCVCREYFFGSDCGIPAAVKYSQGFDLLEPLLTRRQVPKRVLNGFLFNHEFDMLEARLNELKDAVDIFIILESPFTSYGDRKPLRLYERFQKGYMKEFRHKILYVYLDSIPEIIQSNGWSVEHLLRCYLGAQGLSRISGTRGDDVFILSDADEIPAAETVNFLRLYDGFPSVVKFNLKWNVFGFFWQSTNASLVPITTEVRSAVSLELWTSLLAEDMYNLRDGKYAVPMEWFTIGTDKYFAGWHCSWCFSSKDILLKMTSAQRDDLPRLGDDPTRANLTFIEECVTNGRYFYDAPPFMPRRQEDYMYAPTYFMKNFKRYQTLLELSAG